MEVVGKVDNWKCDLCYSYQPTSDQMVDSLELLCDGSLLEPEQVEQVHRLYSTVEGADYAGGLTSVSFTLH